MFKWKRHEKKIKRKRSFLEVSEHLEKNSIQQPLKRRRSNIFTSSMRRLKFKVSSVSRKNDDDENENENDIDLISTSPVKPRKTLKKQILSEISIENMNLSNKENIPVVEETQTYSSSVTDKEALDYQSALDVITMKNEELVKAQKEIGKLREKTKFLLSCEKKLQNFSLSNAILNETIQNLKSENMRLKKTISELNSRCDETEKKYMDLKFEIDLMRHLQEDAKVCSSSGGDGGQDNFEN